MSINSDRLKTLTEEYVGNSRDLFGGDWETLYKTISEVEKDLTEENYKEILSKCEFKNPERVGLIALACPLLCTDDISDIITGNRLKWVYKIALCIWYSNFVIELAASLITWEMSKLIIPNLLCLIITSWSFRRFSKKYNKIELIYRVWKALGKI